MAEPPQDGAGPAALPDPMDLVEARGRGCRALVRFGLLEWGPLCLDRALPKAAPGRGSWGPPRRWRPFIDAAPAWVSRGEPVPGEVALACPHDHLPRPFTAVFEAGTGRRPRVQRYRRGLRGGVVRSKVLDIGWVALCAPCRARCALGLSPLLLGTQELLQHPHPRRSRGRGR